MHCDGANAAMAGASHASQSLCKKSPVQKYAMLAVVKTGFYITLRKGPVLKLCAARCWEARLSRFLAHFAERARPMGSACPPVGIVSFTHGTRQRSWVV